MSFDFPYLCLICFDAFCFYFFPFSLRLSFLQSPLPLTDCAFLCLSFASPCGSFPSSCLLLLLSNIPSFFFCTLSDLVCLLTTAFSCWRVSHPPHILALLSTRATLLCPSAKRCARVSTYRRASPISPPPLIRPSPKVSSSEFQPRPLKRADCHQPPKSPIQGSKTATFQRIRLLRHSSRAESCSARLCIAHPGRLTVNSKHVSAADQNAHHLLGPVSFASSASFPSASTLASPHLQIHRRLLSQINPPIHRPRHKYHTTANPKLQGPTNDRRK